MMTYSYIYICMWLCQSLSCVQLFTTPWAVARQVPLSKGFSRKNTGVSCHSLLQGGLTDSGIETRSPALQTGSLPSKFCQMITTIKLVNTSITSRSYHCFGCAIRTVSFILLANSKYSWSLVSKVQWFQDCPWILKSEDVQVLYINQLSICIQPTHILLYTLNQLLIIYDTC